MPADRTVERASLGRAAVVIGGILLAGAYLFHVWYFARNPDFACFERAATHDAEIGTIHGDVTWYPGLACTFQTSSGELHTAYPGWGATVFAVVAASLIVAGLIARAAPVRLRHHAAAEQEGKR